MNLVLLVWRLSHTHLPTMHKRHMNFGCLSLQKNFCNTSHKLQQSARTLAEGAGLAARRSVSPVHNHRHTGQSGSLTVTCSSQTISQLLSRHMTLCLAVAKHSVREKKRCRPCQGNVPTSRGLCVYAYLTASPLPQVRVPKML